MTSSYLRLPSHLPSSPKFLSHFLTFWLVLFLCCDLTGFSQGCCRGHGFKAVHWIMIMSIGPPLTSGHMAKDSDFLSPSVHRLLLAPLRGWGPHETLPINEHLWALSCAGLRRQPQLLLVHGLPCPSESLSLPSFLPSGSYPFPILFSAMFFEPWKGGVCVLFKAESLIVTCSQYLLPNMTLSISRCSLQEPQLGKRALLTLSPYLSVK